MNLTMNINDILKDYIIKNNPTLYVKYNGQFFNFEYNDLFNRNAKPKEIKFNGPATIIWWEDGTKTVSTCKKGDIYDKEKGILVALLKKFLSTEDIVTMMNHCDSEQKKNNVINEDKKENQIEIDEEILNALVKEIFNANLFFKAMFKGLL